MADNSPRITYIGGPTALIEFGGVRILTDPTFDPPGGSYQTTIGPALMPEQVGHVHVVVLPLHYEGWEHFSESRADVERAFREAGMVERL